MSSSNKILQNLELFKKEVRQKMDGEVEVGLLVIAVGRDFEQELEYIVCMADGDNGCIVAAIKEVLRPTEISEASGLGLYQEAAVDSLAADDRRARYERED